MVFSTIKFDKLFEKILSPHEQKEVDKFKKKLAYNPYLGDFLRRPYFREKKINGKRIYFLIFEHVKGVLMVRVSTKKTQQDTIDLVLGNLPSFSLEIEEKIKQLDGYGHGAHPPNSP